MSTCILDDCAKRARSKTKPTYCRMHDTRVQRHGSPSVVFKDSSLKTLEDIMEAYVPDRQNGACWVWRGGLDKRGYGVVRWERPSGKRGPSRAHRVIYEGIVGPIPDGRLLMHSCDNPPCVNPAHLSPGTDAENLGDMAAKGRSARGSKHRAAKMTERLVVEARQKHSTGKYTATQLAHEYGLTISPMSQLLRGVTWKHVALTDKAAA